MTPRDLGKLCQGWRKGMERRRVAERAERVQRVEQREQRGCRGWSRECREGAEGGAESTEAKFMNVWKSKMI